MDKVIYGLHAVTAYLQSGQPAQRLWVLKGRGDQRIQKVQAVAQQHHVAVQLASRSELDQRCDSAKHQGVVLEITATSTTVHPQTIEAVLEQVGDKPPLILILDGVQDPHNLGACLRTADAVGVDAVILPKNRSASVTPVVRKVACGAAESLPIITVTNIARTMKNLQKAGVWLVGLAAEAQQSIYQLDLTGPLAVVMGSEGEGMRHLTESHCDYLGHIPMQGSVESLNVSVATGVVLFEVARQGRI